MKLAMAKSIFNSGRRDLEEVRVGVRVGVKRGKRFNLSHQCELELLNDDG